MKITRLSEAPVYEAPKHYDMRSLRLQGLGISETENFWVGLSHFLPGGGAEMDTSPLEKVYVMLEGEITIILDDGTSTVLGPLDSCVIPAGEAREIRNDANLPASMIVVMPYAEQAKCQ